MLLRVTHLLSPVLLLASCTPLRNGDLPRHGSPTYARIKAHLDAVPAIDTHDHLASFDSLISDEKSGKGMNLYKLWNRSYYPWFNPLSERKADQPFDEWWATAKGNFDSARAASFYRYQLPAIQELYGVDFDHITDAQARELDRKIIENYRDSKWLYHVVTERANIELVLVDPYWARLDRGESQDQVRLVPWGFPLGGRDRRDHDAVRIARLG